MRKNEKPKRTCRIFNHCCSPPGPRLKTEISSLRQKATLQGCRCRGSLVLVGKLCKYETAALRMALTQHSELLRGGGKQNAMSVL